MYMDRGWRRNCGEMIAMARCVRKADAVSARIGVSLESSLSRGVLGVSCKKWGKLFGMLILRIGEIQEWKIVIWKECGSMRKPKLLEFAPRRLLLQGRTDLRSCQ